MSIIQDAIRIGWDMWIVFALMLYICYLLWYD